MSTENRPKSSLQVQAASLENIPSLTTILARSFHPTNDFIRRCHPDTPLVREYWKTIFEDELNSSTCHVFVAIDPEVEPSKQVAGVICMRLLEADDMTAGFWTMQPYTADHDVELFQPAMDAMIEARTKVFYGTGKRHYLIELLGVDYTYKGIGLGKKLLEKAAEAADAEGYETFVEANASAAGMYKKHGFEEKGSVTLQNEMKYVEHMLVRPAKKE